MLLVYLSSFSPRNRYIFKTAFQSFLKIADYKLTDDKSEFESYQGPKFSYGKKAVGDELFFASYGLLEKKGIAEQDVSITYHQDTPLLFALEHGALPFDPFSASFYMLSRYEEYLPHRRDHYDRFTVSESLAHQKKFLHLAVVDRWMLQVKAVLQERFPKLEFGERKYQYLPTIDIDNAYAYSHKGVLRTIGSLARQTFKFDFAQLKKQILVLLGKRKDPFDTYNFQLNIQKKYKLKPIYFFLLADYGLNDKNLSHENRHFQQLLKTIADYADVGIHPSYGSNYKVSKVSSEIKRLKRIIKRDIIKSRQHFLKLSLPETYRNLIEADILEDYTMGFAGDIGFRAGTCTPYPFYDLDEEVECKLKIFPFQCMEATLKYYLKVSPEKGFELVKPIIDEIKSLDGTFISLWHNESLSNEDEWIGWTDLYEKMIAYAVSK